MRQLRRIPGFARDIEGHDAVFACGSQHQLSLFIENTFDICVLAALSCWDLHQFERHIFWETTQILSKTGLYPVRHFGADGDQLQLHALTPEFFQLIQATTLFLHDVDNHIAEIDNHPVSGRFTFNAQRKQPCRA